MEVDALPEELDEGLADVRELIPTGVPIFASESDEERRKLIDEITKTIEDDPHAMAALVAEIYVVSASHQTTLEQIAQTLSDLLADPKRLVGAFFGGGRRKRRGKHDTEPESQQEDD